MSEAHLASSQPASKQSGVLWPEPVDGNTTRRSEVWLCTSRLWRWRNLSIEVKTLNLPSGVQYLPVNICTLTDICIPVWLPTTEAASPETSSTCCNWSVRVSVAFLIHHSKLTLNGFIVELLCLSEPSELLVRCQINLVFSHFSPQRWFGRRRRVRLLW